MLNSQGFFWVATGTVQYQKNFKRQSLTGKVLPDFRDKALMESIQKKMFSLSRPSCHTIKDWQLVFIISLQDSGVSLRDKGSVITNPTAFPQNNSLSPPVSNPSDHFSSLLTNVLCSFFFFLIQNRALSSESKIFSGRYSFLSMIFLMSLETHLNSSFGWKKLLLLLS